MNIQVYLILVHVRNVLHYEHIIGMFVVCTNMLDSQTTSECRAETNAEAQANAEEATPRREADQKQRRNQKSRAQRRAAQREREREQSRGANVQSRDEAQRRRGTKPKTVRVSCYERK